MGDEIQLISDGDGLAVIGSPTEVERFLIAEGLTSKELNLHRLGSGLRLGAGAAQAGAEIAANAGRWVQLTKESAELAQKFDLVRNSTSGLNVGILRAENGQFLKVLEFAKGPGSLLGNPALLAGAAGIMAQVAMQMAIEEITDYLATIDAKLDDVLRAQKDAVLADMIGVHLVIEEAMALREQAGRVSDVTWSKVQVTPATIAKTQAYALRSLDAIAEKLERTTKIGDLAKTAKEAQSKVYEWLAVLAGCFQLQDAIAVLELDRVLDASPDELDRHRLGLKAARQKRVELIARTTEALTSRMLAAASTADATVMLHPIASREVVESGNYVTVAIADFRGRLGIEGGRESLEAKRWLDAVVGVKDDALEKGEEGIDAARELGDRALDRILVRGAQVTSKLSDRLEKARPQRAIAADPEESS